MRVLLHIGPHKTGTTSLQHALLARYGAVDPQEIWYPQPLRDGPGHSAIALTALKVKDYFPSLPDLLSYAQGNGCNTLILSSEDFIFGYYVGFEVLLASLMEYETDVILTINSVAPRMESIWKEMVKHGWTIDFIGSLNYISCLPAVSLNPILQLISTPGLFRVHVVTVDPTNPRLLFDRFSAAAQVQLPAPRDQADRKANVSSNAIEAELICGFNAAMNSVNIGEQDEFVLRSMLESLFVQSEWRDVCTKLTPYNTLMMLPALQEYGERYVSEIDHLARQGVIRLFGNTDDLAR